MMKLKSFDKNSDSVMEPLALEEKVASEFNLIAELANRPNEMMRVLDGLTDGEIIVLCSVEGVTPICQQPALRPYWARRLKELMPSSVADSTDYSSFKRVFLSKWMLVERLLNLINQEDSYKKTDVPVWGPGPGLFIYYKDVPKKILSDVSGIVETDIEGRNPSAKIEIPKGAGQGKLILSTQTGEGFDAKNTVLFEKDLKSLQPMLLALGKFEPFFQDYSANGMTESALYQVTEIFNRLIKYRR